MKRFTTTLTIALMVMMLAPRSQALNIAGERLNYEIVYQWGAIWKHAGDATLSANKSGSGYRATLVGKTRSWADKVYKVRDTLTTNMNADFTPTIYTKHTHEKNYYARDVVRFSRSGSGTVGKCTRTRQGKPKQTSTLKTSGKAYDMLSVFYMLRSLNFGGMTTGKAYTTVIFSGKMQENLTIRYKGKTTVKMRNGTKREAFHVTFSFTQDGKKKSSDNISAYLSTDAKHVPLLIVGKLPVGQVKCYLAG